MEQTSGGVIGLGTTLCAISADFIQVETFIQTAICAAIGAVVGFVVTCILKRIERKFTGK